MRAIDFTIGLTALFAVPGTAPAQAPEPTPPGLERSLVVAKQGYFPVALKLRDGRIAVVLRGGAPHLGIKGRLDMVFSSDEGKTWSPPSVAVDSPLDDRNPALGQAKDGTLILAYWRTGSYDEKGKWTFKPGVPTDTLVVRSSDGGKTWSEPAAIDITEIGWGSPYGRILTLPDGSLLLPIYGGPVRKAGDEAGDTNNSYLYRSTDDGKTWQRFATPGPGRFNETSLVRLASGKLLAAMRTRGPGEVWLTESADDGKTWSPPKGLTPGKVHPADVVLLPDERVLLVTGYRVGPFGVRGILGDRDGRFDWDKRFILVNDAASGDCGYPSAVVLKDGRVLVVSYATKSLEHPEWGVHCSAVAFTPPAGR